MSDLWVEKHRPQSVQDIRGQLPVVQRLTIYSKNKEFPHLLFAGPPGTGKTTAAMALTKDVFGDDYRQNLLEMNILYIQRIKGKRQIYLLITHFLVK